LTLDRLKRSAERFRDPNLAEVAQLVWRHLALSLEAPMTAAYMSEKAKRLVPSRLGNLLSEWWTGVCAGSGPLDFFHQHQAYRCPEDADPMVWLGRHRVHGEVARDAIGDLARSLERHAERLDALYDQYQKLRSRPPGPKGFGLRAQIDTCLAVLRSAWAPEAEPDDVRAVASALERLGTSLRRIDMARLVDTADLLYEPAVTPDSYLLPRALELLLHWRQNVRGQPSFQVLLEVHDDTGHDVLCLMSLDAGTRHVPETIQLHGLTPIVDLVGALGGQFHLWVARPGQSNGCRCEHSDDMGCSADEYVRRIEVRLRDLAATTWKLQQPVVQSWLKVLDAALRSNGNAALAFVILPRLHE
jgi:hypothetical protein